MKLKAYHTTYSLPADFMEGPTELVVTARGMRWLLRRVHSRDIGDWLALGQMPKTKSKGVPSHYAIDAEGKEMHVLPPPSKGWKAELAYCGRRVA